MLVLNSILNRGYINFTGIREVKLIKAPKKKSLKVLHFWHIVNLSPWPILLSFTLMGMPMGLVLFFQEYTGGLLIFYYSFHGVLFIMAVWFWDIIVEASFEGFHTSKVMTNLKTGMILFIFSEVMFFFAFFWGFFWSAVTPVIFIDLSWPPVGLKELIFQPWDIPFLNTIILLLSGISITCAHLYIKGAKYYEAYLSLLYTVCLALIFMLFQFVEYTIATFDISDSVYASTFFLCTGFHGFHVIIGGIIIVVTAIRTFEYHFTQLHHVGFEAAAWYWHFVDVVWLFLYTTLYYWGSDMVYSNFVNMKGIFFIIDSI